MSFEFPNTCASPVVDMMCRPDPAEEAEMARWLVHATDFGTLATLEDGKPFG